MGWYGDDCSRADKIKMLTQVRSENCKCIKHCYRGNLFRGVLWSVWEDLGCAFIQCDVLEYRQGQWMHKPISEDMHPFYFSCPLGYLNITPVTCEQWREQVINYHKSKRLKAKAKRLEPKAFRARS